jgi:hypothetical protein
VAVGTCCGRDERSIRLPPACARETHFRTVLGQIPTARATRLMLSPSRVIRVTICRSTVRRGPGILEDVHPGLLLCGDGRLATTNVAETARVDNLLGLHT